MEVKNDSNWTVAQAGPRSERGLALIGVVGLLLVFLVFAGALLTQLANEINSVKSSGVSNEALSAADAGVHAMVEQIQTDLANNVPPAGPVDYTYPEPGASPLTTSYHATIDPADIGEWFELLSDHLDGHLSATGSSLRNEQCAQ